MIRLRTLLGLVVFLAIAAPGGVSVGDPRCISEFEWETVDCPGSPGGPVCPESQTWKLCDGTCNASPQEPAYYCESEGKNHLPGM